MGFFLRTGLLLLSSAMLALSLNFADAPAAAIACGEAGGAICGESESCGGMLLWRRCERSLAYFDGSDRDDASGGGGGTGF